MLNKQEVRELVESQKTFWLDKSEKRHPSHIKILVKDSDSDTEICMSKFDKKWVFKAFSTPVEKIANWEMV